MGIEYSARIVVGLPHEELEEFLKDVEDPYEVGLYMVSPYFDADYCDCLFGMLVETCYDYSYTEIDTVNWENNVEDAHKKFTKVTGKVGRLYLSTYGS